MQKTEQLTEQKNGERGDAGLTEDGEILIQLPADIGLRRYQHYKRDERKHR